MFLDILLQGNIFGLPCPWPWALASFLSLLIGWFLGWWLWYKFRQVAVELEKDLGSLKAKYTGLEKDYASLKYQHDELEKDNRALRASLANCESDKVVLSVKMNRLQKEFDEMQAVAPDKGGKAKKKEEKGSGVDFGNLFKSDNLQIVEGIGPKIEKLLKDGGISTWKALAAASDADLKKILEEAGPRYRVHDPKSWSDQAKLAAEGKWKELVDLQKLLGSGGADDDDTPAKIEKMAAKK